MSENVCRISEEAKAPIQGELIRGVPGLNQWERVLSSSDCQKEMRRSVGRPDRKAFREVGPSSAPSFAVLVVTRSRRVPATAKDGAEREIGDEERVLYVELGATIKTLQHKGGL